MRKITYIMLIILLLSAVGVSGFELTQEFRYDGDSYFNNNMIEFDTYTAPITHGHAVPVTGDLDGDGIDEIIVLDGGTVRLYSPPSLSVIDGYIVNSSINLTLPYLYDITGDGTDEFIAYDENKARIVFFDFNGTVISFLGSQVVPKATARMPLYFECETSRKCIAMYANKALDDVAFVNASFFNLTYISSSVSLIAIDLGDLAQRQMCAPLIPVMGHGDIDVDGTIEHIGAFLNTGDSDAVVYIVSARISGSSVALDDYTTEDRGSLSTSTLDGCTGDKRKLFTSPAVHDYDGLPSTGLEVVIGFNYDSNEYKMYSYDKNLDRLDDYPEIFIADGLIISNVITANIFPESDDDDFCVMGYRSDLEKIDLLCASETSGRTPESDEFNFEYGGTFNVTLAEYYSTMISAVNVYEEYTDGNDLDEVINPYGLFKIDYEGTNEMLEVWQSPINNTVMIMADPEQVGYMDVIALSPTNLWYYDDGFVNQPAKIDGYYVNPCLNSVWKANTSVEVRVTPLDPEGDYVKAVIRLYADDANEQNYTSAYLPSGTTIPAMFTANETISGGKLKISVNDIENNMSVQTYNFTFTVSANGVEYGDCHTSESGLVESGAGNESSISVVSPDTNGSMVNIVNNIGSTTGLGTGLSWVLVMVVVPALILLWGREHGEDLTIRGIIAITSFIGLMIIGVKIGFISAGIIITFVLLTVVLGGIWAGRKIFNSGV